VKGKIRNPGRRPKKEKTKYFFNAINYKEPSGGLQASPGVWTSFVKRSTNLRLKIELI
jgi:hypothetical protein